MYVLRLVISMPSNVLVLGPTNVNTQSLGINGGALIAMFDSNTCWSRLALSLSKIASSGNQSRLFLILPRHLAAFCRFLKSEVSQTGAQSLAWDHGVPTSRPLVHYPLYFQLWLALGRAATHIACICCQAYRCQFVLLRC